MDIPNECECCNNVKSAECPLTLFMAMWMCPSCIAKNKELTAASERDSESRVKAERERGNEIIKINNVLRNASDIDNSIQVKSDIFNLETVAHLDILQSIQSDESIADKNDAYASVLLERYNLFKAKIFANNAENVDLANKQRAIQTTLNELKNKLTIEQREKYKLTDAGYKPNQVKIANKKINSPAKPKKLDKVELAKAAARASVPIAVIQMICAAKNMTPMQASDSLLEAGSKKVD